MTRSQRELQQILNKRNDEAAALGRPYIRNPATLQQIAQATDPKAAARIVEGEATGTPAFIDTTQTGPDDNPFEVLIWAAYLGTQVCRPYNAERHSEETQSTWAIFRQALAELIEQDSPFIKIAQSKATNALPALFKKDLQLDVMGNATAEAGGVSFMIDKYTTLAGGLRTQAYMLNDALLSKFSQTHTPTVELPLREYAEMRGLSGSKDQLKDLRKEVAADLEALASISYRCKEKVKGKYQDSGIIRINGGTAIIKNGIIRWNFNADLIPWLERLPPIDYARETLAADPRTNQYYFSRYLDLNYRRNEGKVRAPIIAIKTLLQQSPNIPTVEDVKSGRGSIKQKILIPLFRDLDRIDRLLYDVLDENKEIVDDPLKCDPETVISAYSIRVDYSDYPTHPQRVKQRERREKAKKDPAPVQK